MLEWQVCCSSIVVVLVWRRTAHCHQSSEHQNIRFPSCPKIHSCLCSFLVLPVILYIIPDPVPWYLFTWNSIVRCISWTKLIHNTRAVRSYFHGLSVSTGVQVDHMFTIVQTSTLWLFYDWPERGCRAVQRLLHGTVHLDTEDKQHILSSPRSKPIVRIYTFKGRWY